MEVIRVDFFSLERIEVRLHNAQGFREKVCNLPQSKFAKTVFSFSEISHITLVAEMPCKVVHRHADVQLENAGHRTQTERNRFNGSMIENAVFLDFRRQKTLKFC